MRLFRIWGPERQPDSGAGAMFASLLRDGDHVLDVGADSGDISVQFTQHIACDVIRIDVENFALDAIEVLRPAIARCRPVLLLDVNHWRLDQCQRTTVPDFIACLRGIFPLLYAVDGVLLHDLHDADYACLVMYRHIAGTMRYPALLGAFDRARLPRCAARTGR